MKQTETLETLLERFTKRIEQIKSKEAATTPAGLKDYPPQNHDKFNEHLHYLRGCRDTIEYLMTGQLPNDGNHDGMKHHRPIHGNLDALD